MKKTYLTSMILAAIIAASMTGCGNITSADNTPAAANTNAETSSAKAVKTYEEDNISTQIVELSNNTVSEDIFTERDLEQTADTSEAQSITVADNKTIDITEEGVYVISGTAENCTIKVNADENAKVQLVFDGVSITNDDFPAIYVVSADKQYNDLQFIQCACRFTENCTMCDNGGGGSKRQEIKALLKQLRAVNPAIDMNIFRSVENVNLRTIISYHDGKEYHHFLERFREDTHADDLS